MDKNVVIEIIGSCPLKCPSCLAAESKDCDGMTMKDYEHILGVLEGDVGHIYLSGGEPFAHPKLLDMLKLTKEKLNIPIDIFTSGVILPENIEEYKPYLNYIRVTVKFGIPTLEDMWKGMPGSLDKTRKFMAACNKAGIPLASHHVLDTENTGMHSGLNYIPDMLKFDAEFDSTPIFLPFIAYEQENHRLMLPKRHWRRLTKQLQDEGYHVEMVEDTCVAGFGRCAISRDGNVRGCIYYPYTSTKGNVHNDSWHTITDNLENQRLDMERKPWPCAHCPVYEDAVTRRWFK